MAVARPVTNADSDRKFRGIFEERAIDRADGNSLSISSQVRRPGLDPCYSPRAVGEIRY